MRFIVYLYIENFVSSNSFLCSVLMLMCLDPYIRRCTIRYRHIRRYKTIQDDIRLYKALNCCYAYVRTLLYIIGYNRRLYGL